MRSSETAIPQVETSDDLIDWIGSSGKKGLYLTVHQERWSMGEGEWVTPIDFGFDYKFWKKDYFCDVVNGND
jgi:hypothetical protein